jgi:hypothetical protein
MANYLIVVPRGNTELLDLLSVAFRGHTGFNVVIDRRGTGSGLAMLPSTGDASSLSVEADRRGGRVSLGPDEIVIAERAERTDRPAPGEPSRAFQHIPVRRRRARRPLPDAGGSPRHAQAGSGAATVC